MSKSNSARDEDTSMHIHESDNQTNEDTHLPTYLPSDDGPAPASIRPRCVCVYDIMHACMNVFICR